VNGRGERERPGEGHHSHVHDGGHGLGPWNVLGGGMFKTDEELAKMKEWYLESEGEGARGENLSFLLLLSSKLTAM
jgi:hypothetical protein